MTDGNGFGTPLSNDRAAGVEGLRNFAITRENPIYIWSALMLLLGDRIPSNGDLSIVLPSWVANYLREVSYELCSLSYGNDPRGEPEYGTPAYEEWRQRPRIPLEEAIKLVSFVLGLTAGKWNAFKDQAEASERLDALNIYNEVRATGSSCSEALELVGVILGSRSGPKKRRSERQMYRWIEDGRDLSLQRSREDKPSAE